MKLNINIDLNNIVEEKELFDFKPFKEYYKKIQSISENKNSPLVIQSITIKQVDRFKSNKIGFLKLITSTKHKSNGSEVPGIVLLRGDSISILVVLKVHDSALSVQEKGLYILLVNQPRLAQASTSFEELPAGMLDDSQSLHVKALEELYEETSLSIEANDLKPLSENGLTTSPGLLDEQIHLYYAEKQIDKKELDRILKVEHGLKDHGEIVHVVVKPLEKAINDCRDLKTLMALYLYKSLKNL